MTAEYHKQYYDNIFKDKIQNITHYCPSCDKTITSWNIYKHKNSKNHFMNLLTKEEQKLYINTRNKFKNSPNKTI